MTANYLAILRAWANRARARIPSQVQGVGARRTIDIFVPEANRRVGNEPSPRSSSTPKISFLANATRALFHDRVPRVGNFSWHTRFDGSRERRISCCVPLGSERAEGRESRMWAWAPRTMVIVWGGMVPESTHLPNQPRLGCSPTGEARGRVRRRVRSTLVSQSGTPFAAAGQRGLGCKGKKARNREDPPTSATGGRRRRPWQQVHSVRTNRKKEQG
jgi:hypothetical protein